jgi:hypothetical protein
MASQRQNAALLLSLPRQPIESPVSNMKVHNNGGSNMEKQGGEQQDHM